MKRFIVSFIVLLCCRVAFSQVVLPQLPKTANYTDHSLLDAGFWCAAEINGGSTVMFQRKNLQMVGADYIGGYRFNEFMRVGLGVGANYYLNNNSCRDTEIKWSFPVFLNVRGNVISQEARSSVPYWSMSVGGAIRDGFFLSPTVGYRFGEQRDAWLIGIGYSYNELKVNNGNKASFSSFLLHVGYEF